MANSSRTPTSSAIHGEVFSLKLIVLFLIRGIQAGYSQFKLGTELENLAGKFDDLIFEYEVDGKRKRRCIQAKHKLDGQGRITFDEFISDGKGNFNLPKYFHSYCKNVKINQSLDEIDDLVICTNYSVETKLKNHLTEVNDDDNILGFKDQSGKLLTRRYKIIKDSVLKESLKGPIFLLAKKLFDYANSETQMNEKDVIFKDYHVTLVDEMVIDKTTKRFHPEFANGAVNLSEEAHRLHQVIANISKNSGISDLWKKELKLGTNFGIGESGGRNKIPNYSADETDIDDFVDIFVLAVGAPNEEHLDEIIANEIRHYSKHDLLKQELQWGDFFVKMLNWFKKKKVTSEDGWMTSTEGKQILENIDDMIECFRIDGISLEYRRELLNILEFRQEEIEKMKQTMMHLLGQSDCTSYYEVQSHSTVLISANKVISALNTMDCYGADDSYLVVSAIRLQEDTKRWEKAFLEAKGFHDLLVVICEDKVPDHFDFSTLMSQRNTGDKKLIIVKKGSINNEEQNICVDDLIIYEQLSDATKKNLLSKTILFQGVEKSISDLIADGSDNRNEQELQKRLFNSETLIELLFSKQKVEIPSQNFTQTFRFEKSNYIERQIRCWIWPEDSQFWTKVAEELTCSINQLESMCQRDETSRRINWIVKDKTRIIETMKAISKTNSEMNCYTKLNEDELIKWDIKQGQVIVISGVAGTGKSFTLSRFYKRMKELKPNHWVVAFNLMNHCKALSQIDNSKMNDSSDALIKFLINHFAPVISTKNSCFAQSLLTQRLKETGNITFLLDGFDEISGELQHKTIIFIKALINLTKVDQVFITTRPHMNEKLQDEFHQFVCNLELLEKNDQCSLIVDSWKRKLDENLHDEDYMQTFASSLVKQISNSLKDKDREFIGVPLQCHILAECFYHSLEEALEKREQVDLLIKNCTFNLDLAKLYGRLIKEKITIHNRDKVKTNDLNKQLVSNAIKNIMNYLTKLAVTTILATAEDADILLNRSSYSLSKSKNQQREEDYNNVDFGVRVGLLDKNGDDVEFLHRTYAEYLVADYIFQGFHFDDDKHNGILQSKPIRNLLVKKIFKNDLYEGVMRFLNCMMKSLVESNDWRRMMNQQLYPPNRFKFIAEVIYNEERNLLNSSLNTTLLDLASKRSFTNVFIFLCDCLEVNFNFDPERLHLVFREAFESHIWLLLFDITHIRQLSNVNIIFQRLLQIYEPFPSNISSKILRTIERNLVPALCDLHMNNDDMKQTIRLALEALTRWQTTPTKDASKILTFFSCQDYYDSILFTLLEYLLLLENDELLSVLMKALRIYSYTQYLKRARQETMMKKIVEFLSTKRKSIIINGLLREILLLLGDDDLVKDLESSFDVLNSTNEDTVLHRAAFHNELEIMDDIFLTKDETTVITQLMYSYERNPTPFYIAAARGNEEMCCKILNYFENHRNYYKCQPILSETLADAILFRKVEMIRLVLVAIRKTFGHTDFIQFLHLTLFYIDIHNIREYRDYMDAEEDSTVTVFSEMFNAMIEILISGESSDTMRREELNNLFLENKYTLDKTKLLNEEHFRLLVPIDEFEDWLKCLMDRNVDMGFYFMSLCLHRLGRDQHEQFIKIITETENDSERNSYWDQWFEVEEEAEVTDYSSDEYEIPKMNSKFEHLEKLCEIISSSLGVETLIEKLLLHDKGYAILWGLLTQQYESLGINNLLKANQNTFAKKWIEFLPDVIEKAYLKLEYHRKYNYIARLSRYVFPMTEYADKNQLSKFVIAIFEKPTIGESIWNRYIIPAITYQSSLQNINLFLKNVSIKLGKSQLERLIFYNGYDWLVKLVRDPAQHKDFDIMLSILNDENRCAELNNVIIAKLTTNLKQHVAFYYVKNGYYYMNYILALSLSEELHMRRFVDDELRTFIASFPIVVEYSSESQLQKFIDTLLTTKFPRDGRSIWGEYLCPKVEHDYLRSEILKRKITKLKTKREMEEKRVRVTQRTWKSREERERRREREKKDRKQVRKLEKNFKSDTKRERELKEDSLVTFLKSVREKLKSEYLDKLIFHEDGRIIARFLLWSDEKLVATILNDLPIDLHKRIAECLIDNTSKEFLEPKNSLRLEQGRINATFFQFLKKHVDNQTIVKLITECNPSIWINYLRISVKENEVDSVLAFWSILTQNVDIEGAADIKQSLRNLRHQTINVILQELETQSPNWFTVFLQLLNYTADEKQLSDVIGTITRHSFDPKDVKKKNSLWSNYIYNEDDELIVANVDKLLERVFRKMGPNRVKELVLHSPNERDDPVVICAALNCEDVVNVMLRYLSEVDRKEVEELIKKAQN